MSQQILVPLLLAAILAMGADGQDFEANWQKVRERQPSGLTLELGLPKIEFHQGEIIPATLTFRNTSTNRYHLWIGTYDRSGRIPDITFRAESQDHGAVVDPLGWYFASYCGIGGGLGNEQELGQWSITLPANQWLRFDRPGTYRVYASSDRPQPGATRDSESSGARADLVSDIVTLKILPLGAEQERKVLAEAQAALAKGGESVAQGMTTLRYLQTPATRAMLVPLLQHEQSFDAMMGLVGAPEPAAESRLLLEAAKRPHVAVTGNTIWLYAVLRSHGQKLSDVPQQRGKELQEANRVARSEFVAAVRTAVAAKHGEALLTTVLALLPDSPQDRELRGMLVDHKQELTNRQIEQIVQCWNTIAGDDLLPVLRMAAKPPLANPSALGLLAKVSPADARPLIIEDLARTKPLYIDPRQGRYALEPLEALPDRELPELDEVLRGRLLAKDPDLFTVVPLIARYATTNLLADVLVVYCRAEGRWACDIQNAALRYWIRCQPREGVAALARAMKSRAETGCYRSTLSEVLMDSWNDDAMPVVVEALQDENPEVVEDAVRVLERHASPDVILQVIAAIEGLAEMRPDGQDQAWRAKSLASELRQSKRWQLSPEQSEQLAVALRVKTANSPSARARAARWSAARDAEVAERWAAPPTNWIVAASRVARPYETFSIRIAGPDYGSENWRLSGLTKIDGKEIGSGSQLGSLGFQGYGDSAGSHGIQLVNSYLPAFPFPKSLGEHTVDLVVSTTTRDYHFQRLTVLLGASKEERNELTEFETSGANRFLSDPYGFTPRFSDRSLKERKPMPYAEVLSFVERHPKSYLVNAIQQRIEMIWLVDVNGKGVPPAERLWLGKILAAIDKPRYLADFEKRVQNKFMGEVSQAWLDAIKSYRPGSASPEP